MRNIRLVTATNQKPVLLTPFDTSAEEIDFLESIVCDLHASKDKTAQQMKITAMENLAQCYNQMGFRTAALECLKQMEPLFIEMLEDAEGPIDEKTYSLLICGYLSCGSMNDALRAAEKTARAFAIALSSNKEEQDSTSEWLERQFKLEIEEFQQCAEQKAIQVRTIYNCQDVCETDNAFVLRLKQAKKLLGA